MASRLSPELVDGMNMINLLLPGTAITYNGEEIGMADTLVRQDQMVHSGNVKADFKNKQKFTKDRARTPFQWDSSTSAGVSSDFEFTISIFFLFSIS